MNHIAIDLGDKRCGIAVSKQGIAFSKVVVVRAKLVSWLKKYFQNHQISHVIVGLPYDLYGGDTRQLDKTHTFIKKLQDFFPEKQIIGHDERFSSFQAEQGFDDHRDDIAAQVILQSYLDSIS